MPRESNKNGGNAGPFDQNRSKSTSRGPSSYPNIGKAKEQCKSCGIMVTVGNHGSDGKTCPYKVQGHPNHNDGTKPWKDSAAGKAALALKQPCLQWGRTITGEKFPMANTRDKQDVDTTTTDDKGESEKTRKRGWDTANSSSSGSSGGTSSDLKKFICGLAEMEGAKPTSTGAISKKKHQPVSNDDNR
jgi:hypothetical protein